MQLYLAGPDVFLPEPLAIAAQKCAICKKYGFTGAFPFDPQLDFTGMTPLEQAIAIYRSNIGLMDRCDAIVANMTPFRGPSMDVGTAFEMGYMAAQKKPVFGYSNDGRLYVERVASVQPGFDDRGRAIESFQLADNLMLEGAILTSGGQFSSAAIADDRADTALEVFEAVIQLVAAHSQP